MSGGVDSDEQVSAPGHDTLVARLAQMLIKLNQGELLEPRELAQEFSVSLRTIQRDLLDRFAYLPLEKVGGSFRLDPTFLGKLSTKDIHRFASLAGVRGLFPSLNDDFLRDIFDARMQGALLVKGHNYEDISGKKAMFRELENVILDRRVIGFDYLSDGVSKAYEGVQSYKLINHKGIWYLAAVHAGKIKTFSFSRLSRIAAAATTFQPDAAVEAELHEDDGIWFGENKTEVVLKVAAAVAAYFKRRKLIVNQVIEKELEDGGLIISTRLTTPQQIFPIVRYWLPHLQIISPEQLQADLDSELHQYVVRQKR